jgi:hypothetical protein
MEVSLKVEAAVRPHALEEQDKLPIEPLLPARQALGSTLAKMATDRASAERASLVGPSSLVVPASWQQGPASRTAALKLTDPDASDDPVWGIRSGAAAA